MRPLGTRRVKGHRIDNSFTRDDRIPPLVANFAIGSLVRIEYRKDDGVHMEARSRRQRALNSNGAYRRIDPIGDRRDIKDKPACYFHAHDLTPLHMANAVFIGSFILHDPNLIVPRRGDFSRVTYRRHLETQSDRPRGEPAKDGTLCRANSR
jgi:hypothetical protein